MWSTYDSWKLRSPEDELYHRLPWRDVPPDDEDYYWDDLDEVDWYCKHADEDDGNYWRGK